MGKRHHLHPCYMIPGAIFGQVLKYSVFILYAIFDNHFQVLKRIFMSSSPSFWTLVTQGRHMMPTRSVEMHVWL